VFRRSATEEVVLAVSEVTPTRSYVSIELTPQEAVILGHRLF